MQLHDLISRLLLLLCCGSSTTDPLDCQNIAGAFKGGKHFLDRLSSKFNAFIDHKPALSPAYLLFSVSSLHKCDLYPSSEQGEPLPRERTRSVFSASETHWKAPSHQAWKRSLVKYLKPHLNMLNIEKLIILHHVQH